MPKKQKNEKTIAIRIVFARCNQKIRKTKGPSRSCIGFKNYELKNEKWLFNVRSQVRTQTIRIPHSKNFRQPETLCQMLSISLFLAQSTILFLGVSCSHLTLGRCTSIKIFNWLFTCQSDGSWKRLFEYLSKYVLPSLCISIYPYLVCK